LIIRKIKERKKKKERGGGGGGEGGGGTPLVATQDGNENKGVNFVFLLRSKQDKIY